jgi:hypothetical protein
MDMFNLCLLGDDLRAFGIVVDRPVSRFGLLLRWLAELLRGLVAMLGAVARSALGGTGLLGALGKEVPEKASTQGISDDFEDHD